MQLTEKVSELQSDLTRACGEHFRLVWVVGKTASERTALLRALSESKDGVFIDLGKKLSAALIEIPVPLRTASVENCFAACITESSKGVIFLDHLEVLFEPSLRINPVALVKGVSRNIPIVASWPGAVSGNRLTFGSPDHPGYKELSEQDLEAIVHII
jgi:hypothetical protein